MSVRLITHYSDYYGTDGWIFIFTLANKTYHVKFVFKSLCLLSSKKSVCCPLEGIGEFTLVSFRLTILQDF